MMIYLDKCKGDHCEKDPQRIRESLEDILLFYVTYRENINFKEKKAYPVYTDMSFSQKSIDFDYF